MKYFKNDNNQIFAFDDNCDEKYINENFVEITETAVIELSTPVLSDDETIAINESKRQQLLNETNEKITILQDIIDLDMQESSEEEQLKKWKKYRILLTRVDVTQSDKIQWPEKPV